jgi:hypothetical protein
MVFTSSNGGFFVFPHYIHHFPHYFPLLPAMHFSSPYLSPAAKYSYVAVRGPRCITYLTYFTSRITKLPVDHFPYTHRTTNQSLISAAAV